METYQVTEEQGFKNLVSVREHFVNVWWREWWMQEEPNISI